MAWTATPSFLFVDHDPLWLAAMRRASRTLPGPKHFARSAEEALGLIAEHAPSVVVSCYGLPEGDVLSLLERVLWRHGWQISPSPKHLPDDDPVYYVEPAA